MLEAVPREYPNVLLTGPVALQEKPEWIPGRFSPEIVAARKLPRLPRLAPLTVVRAAGLKVVLKRPAFLAQLAERLQRTPAPAKVLFVLDAGSRGAEAQQLLEVLSFFPHAGDVEFVRGVREAELRSTRRWRRSGRSRARSRRPRSGTRWGRSRR